MNIRSRKAFTLLEIMIVVAIIGLLAVLAAPNYVRARRKTFRDVCLNNQRIIHDGIVEFAFFESLTINGRPLSPDEILRGAVDAGYIKSKNYLDCPAEGNEDHDDYRLIVLFGGPPPGGGGGGAPPPPPPSGFAGADDNTTSTSGAGGGGGGEAPPPPPPGMDPSALFIQCVVKPGEHNMGGGPPKEPPPPPPASTTTGTSSTGG